MWRLDRIPEITSFPHQTVDKLPSDPFKIIREKQAKRCRLHFWPSNQQTLTIKDLLHGFVSRFSSLGSELRQTRSTWYSGDNHPPSWRATEWELGHRGLFRHFTYSPRSLSSGVSWTEETGVARRGVPNFHIRWQEIVRGRLVEEIGKVAHPCALAFREIPGEDLLHELDLGIARDLQHAGREVPLEGAEDGGVKFRLHVVVALRFVILVRIQPQPPVPVGRRSPPTASPRRRRHHHSIPGPAALSRQRLRWILPLLHGSFAGHGSPPRNSARRRRRRAPGEVAERGTVEVNAPGASLLPLEADPRIWGGGSSSDLWELGLGVCGWSTPFNVHLRSMGEGNLWRKRRCLH